MEKVDVSHDTVPRRVPEGVELELLVKEAVTGERGTSPGYVLTAKEGFVRYLLGEPVGRTRRCRRIRQRVEEEVTEATEMLEEREDEFNDDYPVQLRREE